MPHPAPHDSQSEIRDLKNPPHTLLRRLRPRPQDFLAVKLIDERLVRIHWARSLAEKAGQFNAGHCYFAAEAGARTQRKPTLP